MGRSLIYGQVEKYLSRQQANLQTEVKKSQEKAIGNYYDARNQYTKERPFYAHKIRSLTKEVLMKLGVSDAEGQTDLQYRVYRQLCMAKHSNPLFQMQHGYQLRNGNVVAMNGPDTSDSAIRAAWFALEHAARLSFLSVAAYLENHVPTDQQGDLKSKIEAIGAGSQQLAMRAAERFGVEDPFSQKWGKKGLANLSL